MTETEYPFELMPWQVKVLEDLKNVRGEVLLISAPRSYGRSLFREYLRTVWSTTPWERSMSPDLVEKLRTRFPDMFRGLSGVETGDGWYGIIESLCEKIEPVVHPSFRFTQIKEKFGLLRVYHSCLTYDEDGLIDVDDDASKAVLIAINNAEEASGAVCEACGSDVGVTTAGDVWVQTLCWHCRRGV